MPAPVSFVVNRAADDKSDTICTTAMNGGCTLREAVNASNATDPGAGNANTITFDSTVFNTAQTITLAPTYGQLQLTRNAMLMGPGANLLTVARSTAAMTPQFRIFWFAPGTTVSLSGLTVANGNPGSDGGGILSQGTLSVTDVVVRDSQSTNNGGGIEHNGSGTLTLMNVTVSGSTANQGGGIHIFSSTLIATNVTASGNTANNAGGGVEFDGAGATGTLTNVTVSGNTATNAGGGLHTNAGTVNATRSLIAGNTNGNVSGLGINGTNTNNLSTGNPLLAPLGNYGGSTPYLRLASR